MGEYWRFDSTGGDFYGEPLVGEQLVDGEYRRIELERESDGMVRGHWQSAAGPVSSTSLLKLLSVCIMCLIVADGGCDG